MLKALVIDDPFQEKNSEQIIDFQKQCPDQSLMACSIDIKDLYYSIPHSQLLVCVEDRIENYGCVAFENECGVGVTDFLELLTIHLNSTFATWNGKTFIQSNGACIGSCLAPVLSNIYLAFYDRILSDRLEGSRINKVFRFVDDYLVLVFCDSECFNDEVSAALASFSKCLEPLVLTHEVPVNGSIRFLDLRLPCHPTHVCWLYEPRTSNPLLLFSSSILNR